MARYHKRYHRYNRYHKPHYRPYKKPIDYKFKIGIIFIIFGIIFLGLSFLIGKLNAPAEDTMIFAFLGILILIIGLIIISPKRRQNTAVVNINQR